MNRWRPRLLLIGLALPACGNAERPSRELAQPIYEGSPAPEDRAVVAVVNFSGGQCSGSLIAPNLVLTARHCVADTVEKDVQVVCGKTPFDPPDSAGAIFAVIRDTITEELDDYLPVTEIRMVAGQDADLCGTDVALLRLAQPITGVAPLEPRLDEPVTRGERYSAVGYGVDESLPDQPSGVRKRLDDLHVTCNESRCRGEDVRDDEWVGSGGPCQGDSGGPALDDHGRVVGVVSRGKSGCTEPVFSDLVSRAEWLRSEAVAAARAAQRTPPLWSCDVDHPCDAPSEEPRETCAFSPPPARSSRYLVWLAPLVLGWRRGVLRWRRRRWKAALGG